MFGIFKLQTSPSTFYTPPIAICCSLIVQIILVIVFFGLLINRNEIMRISNSFIELSKNGRTLPNHFSNQIMPQDDGTKFPLTLNVQLLKSQQQLCVIQDFNLTVKAYVKTASQNVVLS